MSLQYIRDAYQVPAKRGGRVVYSGNGRDVSGVITGACGGWLRIRLDGDNFSCKFHPTWNIKYLAEEKK